MLFPYFAHIAHFTEFTRGSSLFKIYGIWNMEKSLFMEQSKAEEDLKWRSATPASRFRTEKSPSNKNLPNMMLKTKFPFLYGSTSLDTKALTIASNRNFESCLSIRCLAPQHIFRFFQFGAGISFASGNFALYCVVLLNAPLSDRDQKKKKKCVCNTRYFSREILIHRHWRQEIPLYYWFAVSGGEIVSWRGVSCLQTFMN